MSGPAKDILFLSMEDVVAAGGADVVQAAHELQRGFELFDAGRVLQPHKTTLKVTSRGCETGTGLVNFLPAYVDLDGEEIFCCKALGAMPANVERGIPRATGLITLFDGATKTPLCVMDAQVISAVRTGAVSLLAARKLARPDVARVGLVGAGVNMRTQLLGLQGALPGIKTVRVYSRGESKLHFAREMSARTGLDILPAESAAEATAGADLIVTCLANVTQPVLMDAHVPERGVTVFNIGCYECQDTLLRRMDRIVADLWTQGKHRGAQTHAVAVRNGVIPEERVEDLTPILTGRVPGRQNDAQNVFFCPTGLGFEDAIVAWRVFTSAQQRGIGTPLRLWKSPKWI